MLKTHGEQSLLLLGGPATTATALHAAARISAATGAKLLVETFPARLARGRGVPDIPRLGYLAEQAQEQLRGTRHLILVGARSPVTFFAYPNMPSDLVPKGAEVHHLAADQLEDLADRLGAPEAPASPAGQLPLPTGPLSFDIGPRSSERFCPKTRSSPTKPTPAASCCPLRPPRRHRTMSSH